MSRFTASRILPTQPVEGLVLAAVPPRGPVGDVFVSLRQGSFAALPQGAVVSTSSLRRRAQALHRRPDLRLVDIRGNVETRLRKLSEQNIDGLILAHAGLERFGLANAITESPRYPSWMLPAVGQGALGIERRMDDSATLVIVSALNDVLARQAVPAERAFLRALGGGCQVLMGALTTISESILTLRAAVLSLDGKERLEKKSYGPAVGAGAVGRWLAEELLACGAQVKG